MANQKFKSWQTSGGLWGALFDRVHLLRKEATPTETLLWNCLRKRFPGIRFRRQHTVGHYIVDFVCWRGRLVVEVDGPIHDRNREYDSRRDEFLRGRGFRVLRFSNDEVSTRLESVLLKIGEEVGRLPSTSEASGSPSPTGEGVRG
ncbi:MAG TPA: endonuclease domain-containing protein [Thermoanaerobaculia bacterium]|nr:endonuclease domain-containing protein [Thermoanaerobaculia bacterium]